MHEFYLFLWSSYIHDGDIRLSNSYTNENLKWFMIEIAISLKYLAKSAGAAEYTNCISAEGKDSSNECPQYNTKQSDGQDPVMLELWRVRSTPLLPSLPGQLWPVLIAPDRVLSMGQHEINCALMIKWIVWNKTILTFKLPTYAKLNCLKKNCFYI